MKGTGSISYGSLPEHSRPNCGGIGGGEGGGWHERGLCEGFERAPGPVWEEIHGRDFDGDERGEHDEGCDDYVDEDGGCGRVGSFE